MGKHLSILAPIFILLVIGLWDVNEGQASPIKKHGKHVSSATISKKNITTGHITKQKHHARSSNATRAGKHRIAKRKHKSTHVAQHEPTLHKRAKIARLMHNHAGYQALASADLEAPAMAREDRLIYAPMDFWLAQHFHAQDLQQQADEESLPDSNIAIADEYGGGRIVESYHYWGMATAGLETSASPATDDSWLARSSNAADEMALYSVRVDAEQGLIVAQGADLVRTTAYISDNLAQSPEGCMPDTTGPSDFWLSKAMHAQRERNLGAEPGDERTFKIVESAYNYLGVPYRYGGTTPDGFDCSGFVRHVFNANGIKLGRSSRDQAQEGIHVPLSALKPGDLIFFSMHRRKHYRIDHVGLYIGDGQFIHAASSRSRQITISDLKSVHYHNRVVTARRVTASTN